MRDVAAELKALRLYGMVGAWEEIIGQGTQTAVESSRWLIEHLLESEHTDRTMRSIRYQMHIAKFPVHRDLAGFDFGRSKVDHGLISELAGFAFTEASHNVVFIGGTGTGKTHLATALGVSGITKHSKRVRAKWASSGLMALAISAKAIWPWASWAKGWGWMLPKTAAPPPSYR